MEMPSPLDPRLKSLAEAFEDHEARRRVHRMNNLPPRTTAEKQARTKARQARKRQKMARRRNR